MFICGCQLDDIRLIPRPLPGGPIVEEFPRQIRFVRGTEELIGVAGRLPPTFDVEVVLDAPSENMAPSLSLNGSAIGLKTPVPLVLQGNGRYTGQLPIASILENGIYHLPVSLAAGESEPEFFANIQLSVFPSVERPLFADNFTPEWKEGSPRWVIVDLQATDQVFDGEASLKLLSDQHFGYLRYVTWEPPEPLEGFGYRLHFAFFAGRLEDSGSLPILDMILNESPSSRGETVDLLNEAGREWRGVDLRQETWQVAEIPIGESSNQSRGLRLLA